MFLPVNTFACIYYMLIFPRWLFCSLHYGSYYIYSISLFFPHLTLFIFLQFLLNCILNAYNLHFIILQALLPKIQL